MWSKVMHLSLKIAKDIVSKNKISQVGLTCRCWWCWNMFCSLSNLSAHCMSCHDSFSTTVAKKILMIVVGSKKQSICYITDLSQIKMWKTKNFLPFRAYRPFRPQQFIRQLTWVSVTRVFVIDCQAIFWIPVVSILAISSIPLRNRMSAGTIPFSYSTSTINQDIFISFKMTSCN